MPGTTLFNTDVPVACLVLHCSTLMYIGSLGGSLRRVINILKEEARPLRKGLSS